MCYYPKLIQNPRYKHNKKNGGHIPTVTDTRTLYVPIGCGECKECRKQKSKEWQVRLLEDIKHNKEAKFVTLTFNRKSLKEFQEEIKGKTWYDQQNQIATRAVRLWLERWRKDNGKSLRHWLITELGHENTERIHLHGIVWTKKEQSYIEQKWSYGYVWAGYTQNGKNINYVSAKTINYITKYITKIDIIHKGYKGVILTSAGIGKGYMKSWNSQQNKYRPGETREYYTTATGHKMTLPIYLRNKIYTEEERQQLWIEKLDKNERWVAGQKVSVKISYEEYFKRLEYARQDAINQGFMRPNKEWKKDKYISEINRLTEHRDKWHTKNEKWHENNSSQWWEEAA